MRFETAEAALDEAQRRLDAAETPAAACVQLQVDPPQGKGIPYHVTNSLVHLRFSVINQRDGSEGNVKQTKVFLRSDNLSKERASLEDVLRQLVEEGCTLEIVEIASGTAAQVADATGETA